MAWFSKQKPSEPAAPHLGAWPSSSTLSDDVLVGLLLKTITEQQLIVGVFVLVAFVNVPIYVSLASRTAFHPEVDQSSLDAFIKRLTALANHDSGSSPESEIGRRRLFFLYLASLLKIAHIRAEANPRLWESVVDIWVRLLEASRVLRETLDKTALWKRDELVFFDDVNTPDQGQSYCLGLMVPGAIRFHSKISNWLDRDIPAETRAQINRLVDETFGQLGDEGKQL